MTENALKINQSIPVWALIVGMLTAGGAWGMVVIQNQTLQNTVVDLKDDVKEMRKDVRLALEKHSVSRANITVLDSRLSSVERRIENIVRRQ